ncbi:MAG: cache domain-containing protein [Acidobacteria bacterium]|nr:cache domain-containing protein [Acidobacteriota bacterium]
MPSERYEISVPLKKLLIGLLVTVVPISIVGLYSMTHSQNSLERMVGVHFRIIAEHVAAEVSQFVHDRATSVGVLAFEPVVMDAVKAANQSYQGMGDQAVSDRINQIEKIWNTPAANAAVERILSSPASKLLRRYRDLDRRFLRITVTDEKGAVIAATHKTLDYLQADEDFWQAIYAQGRGAVSLTDILYDDVTKSHYIGVGVPIMEEGSNRFIGVVDSLLEVSAIFPIINRAQLGPASRTLLVKEEGTIISGPQISLAMKQKSDEYTAVQDYFTAAGVRSSGYLVSDLKVGGPHLIAFADAGLQKDYANLGWKVLVSQEASEAFAPIRMVNRMLSFMALMGLATVVFLSVYFSLHRRKVYADLTAAQADSRESTGS